MMTRWLGTGLRLGGALALGAVVTLGLFLFMHTLISTGQTAITDEERGHVVDFVHVEEQKKVKTKDRKPDKPPKPPEKPPKPELPQNQSRVAKASSAGLNIDAAIQTSADVSVDAGISGGSGDGDYLPIVKVSPVYPRRAQRRGIEGYVVVEFMVTRSGTVKNPRVVEADPPGIFNRAAMNAAKKFKYKPKVVNGQPVQVKGVRNVIRFQLER